MINNVFLRLIVLIFICCSFIPSNSKIQSIKYYLVERGKSRYIGVNELNIKTNATASTGTISDKNCLINIESKLRKLKPVKVIHTIGAIYLLCEINYTNGSIKTLSFQDANQGYIKFGDKIYFYSPISYNIIDCIGK